MLFVIDVGNTNIVVGLYEDKKLLHVWRLATNKERTSDEDHPQTDHGRHYEENDSRL